MSLARYLFVFCLPSLDRAHTLCGKTSVPRPQNCTRNSGKKCFQSMQTPILQTLLNNFLFAVTCSEHVPMCLQDHNTGSSGLSRCLSEGGGHGYELQRFVYGFYYSNSFPGNTGVKKTGHCTCLYVPRSVTR